MNPQARARAAKRAISRLPERPRNRLSIADGKVIAAATGTKYVPVDAPAREHGGGLVYGFTTKTSRAPEQIGGAYGRDPLITRYNTATATHDIVQG